MATNSKRFPLQSAIKKILDDPNSRPALPDGASVGDDNFGEAAVYGTGTSPSVALNNRNVVVEVHKSEKRDRLFYHVGRVNGDKIDWHKSHDYDDGVQPSVGITDDGLVVEVHKSQSHDTLFYRVGKVEGETINWGKYAGEKSVKYDDGVNPSVAITNDGLVVEVHKSQNRDRLFYHVGKVEGETINWYESHDYDDGVHPSVAITDDNLVVAVHQFRDSKNFGTIHYHIGTVNGDKINWGGSFQYDSGSHPSVAITDDDLVVEVHQSELLATVWYRGTGQVKDKTITWSNEKSQQYAKGQEPRVTCNGKLAVATHTHGEKLFCSVLTLPALSSNWIELHGENSYCYCACSSAANNKQKHDSSHTMNIKEGAPYFYAVLTKDDDSSNFPTGAILTIEGPDGTKYDRDIQEENQLVIMFGSSVRCLIVKDPKPGDWKMTMTVPEGVGFHCECNTVPTTDVYDTMTDTLENPLQKRFLSFPAPVTFAGFGSILTFEASVPFWGWVAAGVTIAVALGLGYVLQSNGVKRPLDTDQQAQRGKGIAKKLKNAGTQKVTDTTKQLQDMSSLNSKKKNEEDKPIALLSWNFEGATWNDIANSPWYKTKDWFIGYAQREGRIPYKFVVACLQECGTPPNTAILQEQNINGITGLNSYFWVPEAGSERFPLYLYILYYEWDVGGHRVNIAIASTIGVDTREFIQPVGANLRPLIGVKNMDSFFFSLHAASGSSQGGDSWPLLQRVSNQVNNVSWWVAGDYNQEPDLLRQRLQNNNVDVTVCPPDRVTRPASDAKLDYAVRDANANEIIGHVPDFVGARYSDHLPVVYVLEEN